MANGRYARVVKGYVANILSWDGVSGDTPPEDAPEGWLSFSQTVGGTLVLLEDGSPVDTGWRHSEGKFTDPTPPPVVEVLVPNVITNAQARLVLLNAGKLKFVMAAIGSLPEAMRERAEIEWEHRPTIERESPTVALLAMALGLNDKQLDDFFIEGSTL